MVAPPPAAGVTQTRAPTLSSDRSAGTPSSRAIAADPSSRLSSFSSQQPSQDDQRASACGLCVGICAALGVADPATSANSGPTSSSEVRFMATVSLSSDQNTRLKPAEILKPDKSIGSKSMKSELSFAEALV